MIKMKTMTLVAIASLLVMCSINTAVAQEIAPCTPEWGADEEKAKENYSLFYEFYKQKNYKDAKQYWPYIFFNAPGARQTTHLFGIQMFGDSVDAAKDPAVKEKYVDSLLMVYDARMKCFGESGTMGRKAIEMYKYRPTDVENNLAAFERALEVDKNEADYFILLPYIVTAEKALSKNLIDTAALVDKYMKVAGIVEQNTTGKYAAKYSETLDEINKRMSLYLSCDVMIPILTKQYNANPTDSATLVKTFNSLFSLQCFSDPLFKKVAPVVAEKAPNEKTYYVLGVVSQNEGNYTEAIGYFQKALNLATANADKATYAMGIARLYQAKKDYPSARTFAQKAAGFDTKTGEPYMLIGDLYMSSGPLCGSGTGWESQVVTWPAVDMYEKAKSVDPSLAAEANKKIANASKYYPTKGECFFRDLATGASFKVECWINTTTTVRCAAE